MPEGALPTLPLGPEGDIHPAGPQAGQGLLDEHAKTKDADGETVLKPNARLQMLLTQTSPTHAWTDPPAG